MESNMKTVVITGSTRGIGLGLAREFLKRGHQVVVSGTSKRSVERALGQLDGLGEMIGQPCQVQDYESVQSLWNTGFKHFGKIDIWINNAGVSTTKTILDRLQLDEIHNTVDTNLIGSIFCTKVAAKEMLKQGFGQIYMFEGFGSNGQLQPGITVYGSTKRALRYFTAAVANEYQDTPLIIGSLSPGIVATDLLLFSSKERSKDDKAWEKSKKILNILGDHVETVTPWLVEETLKNNKNGAQIAWLTRTKVITRFFSSLFVKRNIIDEWEARQD